jgi:hypothetical protein
MVGSMVKPSLARWCRERGIPIHVRFGREYLPGEARDLAQETAFDFRELIPVVRRLISGR